MPELATLASRLRATTGRASTATLAPSSSRARSAALLLAIALLAPVAARAQSMPPYVPVGAEGTWRTLETPHFVVHAPSELLAWTRDATTRLEAERAAVRRLVGWAPSERVTVLVADPYNQANGSAYPFLRGPAVFLWPVPPDPRAGDASTGRWGDLLAVHEFAHVAHLARPTRNPLRRALASLLPTNIGPIGAHTPPWVWEGYATYVEGRLTGAGRPHGVWRPAYLREWAIEGRLPTYGQVSSAAGFAGGSFRYYAGSAFFEWLVAQRGDSSLPALWRRMTARTPRSFEEAFAGVFPGSPAELYARWSAQVTAEAVAAERALATAPGGIAEGTLVQRLRGATGDPAVSPDGDRVALVVRPAGQSSRVVVWRTGAEPVDTARRRAARAEAARARQRDPEDVPAVPYLPAPKRAVATLLAKDGRSFAGPRWLPDGERVLVERAEFLHDGRVRPDLWTWDTKRGTLRRVTHGAAVQEADPSPTAPAALATRCTAGWCDVVRVDLASGAVTVLLHGSPTRTFSRPRWAPDGHRFAVAAQDDAGWHVLLGDASAEDVAESLRGVGPSDDAARYDPAFTRDGAALFVTSERGGVPNVKRVDIATGATTTLTRATGAAFAPEPLGARALYFLTLRSTGLDLRRLSIDSASRGLATVTLAGHAAIDAAADAPDVPNATAIVPRVAVGNGARAASEAIEQRVPPARRDTFPTTPPERERAYGVGRLRYSLLPAATSTRDGSSALLVVTAADPVGRLTATLAGAAGEPATWRGGALSMAYHGMAPTIDAQLFGAAQHLSPQLDVRYRGALLAASPRTVVGSTTLAGRVGASWGQLDPRDGAARPRTVRFAEYRVGTQRGRGDASATLAAGLAMATGTSDDSPFTRWTSSVALSARTPLLAVRASYVNAAASAGSATFERMRVGGAEPVLLDASLLGQRVAMPALPTGALAGRRVETARVALGGGLVGELLSGFVGGGLIEPYAWAGRADATPHWLRVLGAEASWVTGPIPFARAPGVRAVAGVGYPFDGPTRRRLQGYLSVALRP